LDDAERLLGDQRIWQACFDDLRRNLARAYDDPDRAKTDRYGPTGDKSQACADNADDKIYKSEVRNNV
jgi:hypothetical protein